MSPISRWISITRSTVLRRVEPPAPIVTETKPGLELLQVLDRPEERAIARVRLRRKELEGDDRVFSGGP